MPRNLRTTRRSALRPEEQVAFEAWSLLLRAHARLVTGLDEALREREGMTLSAYDLLVHVASATDRRITMRELEERRRIIRERMQSRHQPKLRKKGKGAAAR